MNHGDRKPWSSLAADEVLLIHPHYINFDTPSLAWNYPQGLILHAIWNVWRETHQQKYMDYVKESLDFYLPDTGGIKTYVQEDFRQDDILMGRVILDLYESNKEVKYKNAATVLRAQLRKQPRTLEGGFWHKKVYPDQMWLDGMYMSEPFYAQYAKVFNEPRDFDDIAKQFILMANHARDPKTGLMYHGWDFQKKEKWSDPKTGNSPCFWGRSIGWYMMGLVDVLDYFPTDNPKRQKLISVFRDLCSSVLKYQDQKTHLWYQVVDQPGRQGNFPESSASAMFAYSFAKGAKKQYLSEKFFDAATEAFDGLVNYSVKMEQSTTQGENGTQSTFVLENTSGTVGLGGSPYRDGSYKYYTDIPKESNDFRGIGPFILAALQIENVGEGKEIGLDYYFNNEWKKDSSGVEHRFHYVWEDTENTGYSDLGKILTGLRADVTSVASAPTEKNLNKLGIYIIVDPDTPLESPSPNYIDENSIGVIVNWVKHGGVLVLFANDSGNCEFTHLNRLAGKFGIHFNENLRNHVIGQNYNEGAFDTFPPSPIFRGINKIFLKDICTLKISNPAKEELVDKDDVIMASSKFGKGFVFAVGDPWFYNEYMNTQKLPGEFENEKAARNLFSWLLRKAVPNYMNH